MPGWRSSVTQPREKHDPDAFAEGVAAHRAGKTPDDNPYPNTGRKRTEWARGHAASRTGRLPEGYQVRHDNAEDLLNDLALRVNALAGDVKALVARADASYQNPGFKRVRDSVARSNWLSIRKARLAEAKNELRELLNSWGYKHGTENDRKGAEYSIRVFRDRIKENEMEIDADMRAYGPEQ